ncbi:MAG: nuoN, partial [Armatimonadetes bacterium]|nr:nuoN [Armatimonadota bacterium]
MGLPTAKDVLSIAPQLIVAGIGMLVLLLDAIWPRISKRLLANISVLGLVISGVVGWSLYPKGQATATLQNMVMPDGFTAFFTVVFAIAGALAIWMSYRYLELEGGNLGEYYALILFTTSGALVMASSINLICIFIGLEILSIALYILAGYQTEKLKSDESALKYFLLGAFASAFFLYGIALIYGATGSVNIQEIASRLSGASESGVEHGKNFLLLAGIALLLVGFGFKVAVVPFHIWTPDVYEGAPTSVTAFMSVTAKAAGFAAFLRVIAVGFTDPQVQLQVSAVLASIAALTMLVGNVVAVVQPNIKRMLAYSSIAHAGYILCGLVATVRPGSFGLSGNARQDAISAVLFYTLAYTVSNLGAFGVVLALRKKGEEVTEISDLAGIGARYPLLAVLMSLFMLSLAG